jgi:hypothetical protein
VIGTWPDLFEARWVDGRDITTHSWHYRHPALRRDDRVAGMTGQDNEVGVGRPIAWLFHSIVLTRVIQSLLWWIFAP